MAGGRCPDLQRHTDSIAGIVAQRGSDERQIAGARAQILREHLLVALESSTGDHHSSGRQSPGEAVAAADDEPAHAAIVSHRKTHGFRLVENLGSRRPLDDRRQAVHDAYATARGHSQATARVAVRERLLEVDELDRVALEEQQRLRDFALQRAAVVEIRHAAGHLVHSPYESRVEPAVLGDAKPGARPARRTAAPLAGRPLDHRDACPPPL